MLWTNLYLQDAGGQGIGFLLGSLNVKYALTSEACHKSLSKTASGEVVQFKGVLLFLSLILIGLIGLRCDY